MVELSRKTGMTVGIVATGVGLLFADILLIMAGALVLTMENSNRPENNE